MFWLEWYLLGVSVMLGAAIGSFLDVFVSRYNTGASINDRSHCTSCGGTLKWYDMFPVISYVVLSGRCRFCGARISIRLWCMEIITAALFGWVFLMFGLSAETLFGWIVVSLAIAIAQYDMRHFIIPDGFIVAFGVLAVAYQTVHAWTTVSLLTGSVFAMLGAVGVYGSLWFVSGGRWMGFGDVKLAAPLGFLLTPYQVVSFVMWSFWLGAVMGVFLVVIKYVLRRGQLGLRFEGLPRTIKSEVPFAPFILAAFLLVFFGYGDVLRLFGAITW